jgi:Icc-related predicted phosphoesterase
VVTDPHARDKDNRHFYRSEQALVPIFAQIPNDVQYLITHTPPCGVLDVHDLGSTTLRDRIKHLKHMRVMQFGHVHSKDVF